MTQGRAAGALISRATLLHWRPGLFLLLLCSSVLGQMPPMLDQLPIPYVKGVVEIVPRISPIDKRRAYPGSFAALGENVVSGTNSLANLQVDLSVFRLDQLSQVEVGRSEVRTFELTLSRGKFFFFDQSGRKMIVLKTPEGGTITNLGTEFHVARQADRTTITMIDGLAILRSSDGQITQLTNRQEGFIDARAARKTSDNLSIESILNTIDWALYYPDILDVADLHLPPDDAARLQKSIASYRSGSSSAALSEASAVFESNAPPESGAAKLYLAALRLAAGQVRLAEDALNDLNSTDGRLRRLAESIRQSIGVAKLRGQSRAIQPEWATEWMAESYYQQARSPGSRYLKDSWEADFYRDCDGYDDWALRRARKAAEQATRESPEFGLGWARLAELEFGFGKTEAAWQALSKVLGQAAPDRLQAIEPGPSALSPNLARAHALRGFLLMDKNRFGEAQHAFEEVIRRDGALANGWLGLGLTQLRSGKTEQGLQSLQMAAAQEPQSSLYRSYLGKALSHSATTSANPLDAWTAFQSPEARSRTTNLIQHAREQLEFAKELNTREPTPWLYSALLDFQENRINDAIRELERSKELNDNRRLFRSRLLLDQDRAVRGANLAAIYREAGMTDWSVREAARAVDADYANPAAHLFLASSYDALRDPRQINLRYETPWLSEFLLANLLAPVGAGTLSQSVSQQEYSRLFERDRLGIYSRSDYFSSGDWIESGSVHGTFGATAFALDAYYLSQNGRRSNEDLESLTFWPKIKQQLTRHDTLFLQAIYYDYESGDVAQYLSPTNAHAQLRVRETQDPIVVAGYQHEWQPGNHTLVLLSRLQDTRQESDPDYQVLLLGRNNGQLVAVPVSRPPPVALRRDEIEFEAYSAEVQQIMKIREHSAIFGARYQNGNIDNSSALSDSSSVQFGAGTNRFPGTFRSKGITNDVSLALDRFETYGYLGWKLAEPLTLTLGLSYSYLRFPSNARIPPINEREETTSQLSPKVGLVWMPGTNTILRGGFARSIEGATFDQSFRLEPTQVAGFNQAFRTVLPQSIGSFAGVTRDEWGVALEQKIGSGTYLTVGAELLESRGERTIGAFDITGGNLSTSSSIDQRLRHREKNLAVSLDQRLGPYFTLGAHYQISQAELDLKYPDIPISVTSAAHTDEKALLQQLVLSAVFNHHTGFFGILDSIWIQQSNEGVSSGADEDFWHFNAQVGYRFAQRRVRIAVGVLNLTNRDYQLNPLNFYNELPRDRTFMASLKFEF